MENYEKSHIIENFQIKINLIKTKQRMYQEIHSNMREIELYIF